MRRAQLRLALEDSAFVGAHSHATTNACGDRAQPSKQASDSGALSMASKIGRADRRGDSAPARVTRQSSETV
jgi:hypothetical protein